MATKLNKQAYQFAQGLIKERRFVLDQRDDWSEHRPSAGVEDRYLEEHGWDEYRNWYLGVDDQSGEDTKSRYKFPYGDFQNGHRCGVLSAESRAGQYKHFDVESAASHLLSLLDEQM